jgi:hypothetical protein
VGEFAVATEELKGSISSGVQMLVDLIQVGSKEFYSEIHELILFGMRKNCHSIVNLRHMFVKVKIESSCSVYCD